MEGIHPASIPSFANATIQEVFEGLRDFRNLTRDRALEALRKGLSAGQFEQAAVETSVLSALAAQSWEARQGALCSAAEALKVWDRPDFRSALLRLVPRLLVDTEYRVRKAVAPVLKECCSRDGLSVFDSLSGVVLGDIRDKFRRTLEEKEEDPNLPPAPPSFLPDTEGWRSLETSMSALESMMQGCGAAFTPRIDRAMLDLLAECSRHTNRFVREYAYFALKNAFDVCSQDAFLESVAPLTVGLVQAGIRDNWSQVRYAASVAARAFVQKAGEHQDRFFPELLGNMCLNRHYVAEGVRLYSQDTWRLVCGPQGGARLLVAHFDTVIDAYIAAAQAPNHAVREAACHCIAELGSRVAGSPTTPTVHREHFTHPRVQRLLQTLLASFQDESWPVRDVASTALGHFVTAFPVDCEDYRAQLTDLWFEQMADNIPSLRRNGAAALAMAVGTWTDQLWDDVTDRLAKTLPSVVDQPEKSEVFADYTPSGPFSVPRPKPASFEDKPDPEFMDQTMYSCGSVAPKTFKRRQRVKDSGCMNCATEQPKQLWESSEGMVHLLADLAILNEASQETAREARAIGLAGLLPALASAFGCSHYRHHHLLKQRVCERLPSLSTALGSQRLLPHLPALLKVVAECAAQDTHHALREGAKAVLIAWQRQLPSSDLEAACRTAGLDTKALLAA